MPDAVRAYRTLDHIEANTDSWDQAAWYRQTMCGTAACHAGWTVLLAGGRIHLPGDGRTVVREIPGMEGLSVPDAAAQLLGIENAGLPDGEPASDALFYPDNTLDDLRELTREIFGPRPQAD